MGVTIFVNSPADTTNNQTENSSNQNNLKLYPYDFTSQDRKFKSFKLIARVRDIMNVIQGPKIMDININKSNDINKIFSHDGTGSFITNQMLTNAKPQTYYWDGSGSDTLTIGLQNKEKLYIRRDGENANAMTAIDYMTANYNEQASRITSNAPSDSMYAYPFVFSNYTLDPALRPLCVDPIIKWYWGKGYTIASGAQVSVLPISKLNTNIQSSTIFPGALVPFPDNAIVLDCSTLSSTTIGKLYKLSPYIIDVSNTHEGLFNAVTIGAFDTDVALALDHTYSSQDIEFGLFLASLHIPTDVINTNLTINVDNYKYDPVEAIFSYFSTKKYEFTDNPLYNMSVNSAFKANIIYSNRIGLTYLIQQAAKQMHIWLSPAVVISKGTYTINQINYALAFNTDVNLTFVSSSAYRYFPKWIPYEYVKASNNNIELDKTTWVSGRGNRKIAKYAVKPRSFYYDTSAVGGSTIVYFNKYGESFSYTNSLAECLPTSIYVQNLPDRCIYTTQVWNEDVLLNDDYLEESDYFPVPDLVTDI